MRRRPSPSRLNAEHRDEDRQNGKDQIPRRLVNILPRVGDHLAPGWRIGAHAHADERQDGLDNYSDAHFEAHQRDQQRNGRRHDLARDGAPVAETDQARRGDVIAPAHHQHFAAQHAAEARPIDQDDGEDHVAQPGAEPDHEDQRQDHRRKRHPDIDDATDQPIDLAPEVAGNVGQHAAEQHRAKRSDHRHSHGDARPIDEAREHVAAEAVGTERKLGFTAGQPGRWQQRRDQVLVVGIVRREQWREHRRQGDNEDDRQSDQHARGTHPVRQAHGQAIRSFGLRTMYSASTTVLMTRTTIQ